MLPEKVDLTYEQIQNLKTSIHDSNLSDEDKALIKGLIDFNGWLQQQLLEKKISINRLKMIIFGEPLSKGKNKKSNSNTIRMPGSTDSSNDEIITDNANQDVKPITTNNGRLSHSRRPSRGNLQHPILLIEVALCSGNFVVFNFKVVEYFNLILLAFCFDT